MLRHGRGFTAEYGTFDSLRASQFLKLFKKNKD